MTRRSTSKASDHASSGTGHSRHRATRGARPHCQWPYFARLSRRGIAHTISERPTSSGTAAHGDAAGFGIGVGTTPAYAHQVIGLLASRAPA
ncbi:hypothetical protein ACIBL8_45995 [Streptomyces sp. NPDC050523]|uniref:hypothetical protein n=1 Tax=Streptomyces sp. NPDC050523 TaxID=3365622 RepID=UPI0037941AB5